MPLKRCGDDGQGWKWGDEGRCYTGKDAKKKAIRQGLAIEGPEKFSQKAIDIEKSDAIIVTEWMREQNYPFGKIAATIAAMNKVAEKGTAADAAEKYLKERYK